MHGTCCSFPCRSGLSGTAEPSLAPLSHPPTAHSMPHAQLGRGISTTVVAKLSGPKSQTNKSALLPTFLSLLRKRVRLLLALFPSSIQSSGRPCAFVFTPTVYPFKSAPPNVMMFPEFWPLSQGTYSAEARSLEQTMNSFLDRKSQSYCRYHFSLLMPFGVGIQPCLPS